MTVVAIDGRARSAWPWLPPVAPIGAVMVGPTGETLRVRADRGCDPWPPDGHRSIASDPTASPRRPGVLPSAPEEGV